MINREIFVIYVIITLKIQAPTDLNSTPIAIPYTF